MSYIVPAESTSDFILFLDVFDCTFTQLAYGLTAATDGLIAEEHDFVFFLPREPGQKVIAVCA